MLYLYINTKYVLGYFTPKHTSSSVCISNHVEVKLTFQMPHMHVELHTCTCTCIV